MATVRIFADLNRLLPSLANNSLTFTEIHDYPKLYKTVRDMLANEVPRGDIIVQNRQLLSWIKEFNRFEPNDTLDICEMNARQYVTTTWGNILPSYLKDEDIQAIMDVFPMLNNHGNFEAAVLEHYFKFSFEFPNLTAKTLNAICTEGKFHDYKKKSQNRGIKLILNHQKEKAMNKHIHFPLLIDLLFESPKRFITQVSCYTVLKNYSNTICNRFLEGYIRELSNLNLRHFVPATETLPTEITNSIIVELKGLLSHTSTQDETSEIIRCTSGIIESEFELLIDFIDTQVRFDRNHLIGTVRLHFSGLLAKQPLLVVSLEQLVTPAFPTKPDYDEANKWLEWAEKEYLPYRRWQEMRKLNNELLDYYGVLFSDWLASNYLEIKYAFPKTLVNLLPNIKAKIDNQVFTLLLIIDNMGLRWSDYLTELFRKHSMELLYKETFVAAVPTETRISKTALLSANYVYSKNEQDYRKLTEQKTSGYFNNKRLLYTTKVSDLKQLPEEVDFAILNYVMIDHYMHQDQDKMASPRFDVIANELKDLIDLICKSIEHRPQVDIYVVSDHGSVKIQNEQAIQIDDILLGDKIVDIAERYFCVTDAQLKRFRSRLERVGYIFERSRFDLDANYVIIKGNNSLKKNKADLYLHGGISPEEILVPLLHFHRSSHTVIHPNLFLMDNTFRYNVKSRLSITIENTNPTDINTIQLTVVSPFVSLGNDTVIIDKIDAMSKREIVIENVRFLRKGNSSPTVLSIDIQYHVASQKYNFELQLPIIIKAMQENTIDFDF